MSWLPKSPKARRRLWVVAAVAPVLALAVGLSLWAMQDSVTFFYSPSEATVDKAPEGRNIRLGGLVETGSVRKSGDGVVVFTVTDNIAATQVQYHGDLPDLFREGQGIVAQGAFGADAEAAFRQAVKHDPDQLGARFFLGEAALRRGDAATTRAMWTPLIAALDPADPRRKDLERRLPRAE